MLLIWLAAGVHRNATIKRVRGAAACESLHVVARHAWDWKERFYCDSRPWLDIAIRATGKRWQELVRNEGRVGDRFSAGADAGEALRRLHSNPFLVCNLEDGALCLNSNIGALWQDIPQW